MHRSLQEIPPGDVSLAYAPPFSANRATHCRTPRMPTSCSPVRERPEVSLNRCDPWLPTASTRLPRGRQSQQADQVRRPTLRKVFAPGSGFGRVELRARVANKWCEPRCLHAPSRTSYRSRIIKKISDSDVRECSSVRHDRRSCADRRGPVILAGVTCVRREPHAGETDVPGVGRSTSASDDHLAHPAAHHLRHRAGARPTGCHRQRPRYVHLLAPRGHDPHGR